MPGTPDWFALLVSRLLRKNPADRLQSASEVLRRLEDGKGVGPSSSIPPAGVPVPVVPRRNLRERLAWVVAAVLAIALVSIAAGRWRRGERAPALQAPVRVSAELFQGAVIDRFRGAQLALSPDGTRIVVAESEASGKWRLVTRSLDQSQFAPLLGAERGLTPFFSPDGEWIGFFSGGKLKKLGVQGGAPVTLFDAPRLSPRGGSWGDDGNIIAAFNEGSTGLVRVSSGGGVPTGVTQLRQGETAHAWPQVLPGSQAVLFTSYSGGADDDAEINVLSLKTGERRTLHRGGFSGRYLPSGHLVYQRQNTLFVAPFDLGKLAMAAPPQPILEEVNSNVMEGGDFAFSETGTLVYVNSKVQIAFPHSIWWLDSRGQSQPLHVTPGIYENPRFSPDGKRLAFSVPNSPARADIWVKDIERDTLSRLTQLPGRNNWPLWTPDGKSMVFASYRHGATGIYWIRADGAGPAQRLTETDGKTIQYPCSFSPDGKRLAFGQWEPPGGGRAELWTAPVEGDPDHFRLGKAEAFLRGSFWQRDPAFSPDGRWLAYSSNESGTQELYVRPFSGAAGKLQVSTGGGQLPIWSHNQRKLFFLTPDWRIMVVDYSAKGDSFSAGKPQLWFDKSLAYLGGNYSYDLAPDGKRFAVVRSARAAEQEQRPSDSVMVVLNFFDELRRKVPAGKN
jgi:serine/threonine-protein kinase